MVESKPNRSGEFKTFLSSPLGKELVNEFGLLRQGKLQDAERGQSSDGQVRLTNQAYGIRLALEHLQFLATVVLPKDEGSKAKH